MRLYAVRTGMHYETIVTALSPSSAHRAGGGELILHFVLTIPTQHGTASDRVCRSLPGEEDSF